MTLGKSGSWVKKYSKRSDLEQALSTTRHVESATLLAEGPRAYVDGSCILGQWSACAVFFSAGDERNEVQVLSSPHTAPRAELAAILLCLSKGFQKGQILSDSTFACRAFARGWPVEYLHQDLISQIRAKWTSELSVVKVKAHSGEAGNEVVDAMLRDKRMSRS